jgi:hypothetical protein
MNESQQVPLLREYLVNDHESQYESKRTSSVEGCVPVSVTVSSSRISIEHDDIKSEEVRRQFYFTVPWSPQIYFSVRGSENFHIYLWIAKDLAWAQDWYFPALVFGIGALIWCAVLSYHAFRSNCSHEMYLIVGLIFWLSANFIWMAGKTLSTMGV